MPTSPTLLPTLRWITLTAIGGTIVATGVNLASVEGPWLWVALGLAVVSFVCCATALHLLNVAIENTSRSFRKASHAAELANHEVDEQSARFDSMRNQLEEYQRLQEELTAAKQAAEQATMAKSEFLATMSHEVRTPLNGIVPMLELLQSSKLALDQREMLSTALQSARQLLRIVDDILDYSKLEAHKLQLETVALNLRETLDSVIRLLERPAQGKGLRLSLHIDADVRPVMRGDPVRIRQIVSNLVSNALKFTERGSIAVHVARLKESRTHHQLRIEVRDTGVGISPEAAGKLFTAFSQADASTTRVYGGTGLGLAICKRIVDLMGGRIGVDSELGRGSTFWFEIPLLKVAGEIDGPRASMQDARVLVLTNDPALRKQIEKSLGQAGVRISFVENTQDALQQLRATSASVSRSFDVLIVDAASIKHTIVALHRNLANMTEVDRLRVLFLESSEPLPEGVRELANTVVVQRTVAEVDLRSKLAQLLAGEAISTAGSDSRAAVSLTAADEEPVDAGDGAVSDAPRGSAASPVDGGRDGPAPTSGPIKGKLLLVEDNPVNLLVAQRLISLLGPHVDTAENGEQAIEKLTRGHYDIVLMDCQMPVMDGYAATRAWRAHEAENSRRALPIIAMTANAMAGDRQKCLDAGMDDYLSKPVARDQLEALLRRWMSASTQPRRGVVAPEIAALAQAPAAGKAKAAIQSALTADEIALASMKLEEATVKFEAEQAEQAARAEAEAEATRTRTQREGMAGTAAPAPPAHAAAAPAPATAVTPAPVTPAPVPPPVAAATSSVDAGAGTPNPQQAAPGASQEPPPAPAAAATTGRKLPPALDVEIIEDLWSAMGDSFTDLVHVFLEDAPSHLAKLDAALASHDVAGLVGPAHALKSSSANLGAMQMSAAAKHIEHGARDGSLVQPHVAVKVLAYEFRRAESELRSLLA